MTAPVASPLRVLVVGAAGDHRTEASLVRAARALGHAARLVDTTAWRRLGMIAAPLLRRRVDAFRPDWVIFTRYAAELDDTLLAELARGRRTAAWFFDLTREPYPPVVRLGRIADALYVTYPSLIRPYRAAGARDVRFLPQGLDPALDRPAARIPERYRCDVAFVGSGQYPYRHALLRAVAAAGGLHIRGGGWDGATGLPVVGGPVRGAELARVIGGAAISLGANSIAELAVQRRSASNRMWKILGCGGFYLGPRVEGIEEFARGGEHCAWYDEVPDAVAQVRRWLGDPERRAAVAAAGRAHALAHHTYAHRLALLLADRGFD